MGDPIRYLERAGDDWTIAAAVVYRAHKIHAARRGDELNQLAKAIGGHVGNAVAQLFK